MASLKTSILFSFGEKYIAYVIQFATSIAIARLLSPQEIGIFSIGSLILSLSHVVRDLGVSNYIIQEKELSPARIQTAQTLVILMSWFLALLTWGASGLVSDFYHEPGIGRVMVVLSLNFLVLPFGSVAMAIMKRQMKFGRLLRINTAATLTQAGLAIGLCASGSGFIGLAWAGVASTLVTVGMAVLVSAREVPWRPGLREWRHVLSIGGRFSGSSMLWELGLSSPEMIVGKVVNIEAAGYLGRAQGVVGLVYRSLMEGLAPVLMPFFAQSHRDGGDVGERFLKSVRVLTVLTFPIFLCLALAMDAIVQVLYGMNWNSAIAPARILCVGMAALSIAVVAGSAVSGMGESKYSLRFQLVGQPIKIVLVFFGSFYSISHVAAAMVLGDCLIAAYTLVALGSLLKLRLARFFEAIAPSVLVALGAGLACFAFKLAFPGLPPFSLLMGCMLASLVGWLASLFLSRHEVALEMLAFVRRRVARPRNS